MLALCQESTGRGGRAFVENDAGDAGNVVGRGCWLVNAAVCNASDAPLLSLASPSLVFSWFLLLCLVCLVSREFP